MFDTVHFRDYRAARDKCDGDWEFTYRKKDSRDGAAPTVSMARHKHLELKAFSHDDQGKYFDTFQVPSLPALLYGHNGIVLHSQEDLNVAVKVADLLFDQICTPIAPEGDRREYSRADIAIQLAMNYKELEIAYTNAKQHGARKTPEIHPGESIVLPLSGQRLVFYNKQRQMAAKRHKGKKPKFPKPLPFDVHLGAIPGVVDLLRSLGYQDPPSDIVRIEVQLQKNKIKRFLGDGEGRPKHLDLIKGYRTLREVLCAIRAERFPGVSKRIATFLALVNYRDPELFEIYLDKCVGADRAKKLRREVGRLMPSVVAESIRWENLLPEDYISSQQIHLPGPGYINFDPDDPEAIHKTNAPLYQPLYPELVKEAKRLLGIK